jgi:hypothetical protein
MFLAPIRGDTGRRKENEFQDCCGGWEEFTDVRVLSSTAPAPSTAAAAATAAAAVSFV